MVSKFRFAGAPAWTQRLQPYLVALSALLIVGLVAAVSGKPQTAIALGGVLVGAIAMGIQRNTSLTLVDLEHRFGLTDWTRQQVSDAVLAYLETVDAFAYAVTDGRARGELFARRTDQEVRLAFRNLSWPMVRLRLSSSDALEESATRLYSSLLTLLAYMDDGRAFEEALPVSDRCKDEFIELARHELHMGEVA